MQEKITIPIENADDRMTDDPRFVFDFISGHREDVRKLLGNHWYSRKATVSDVVIAPEKFQFAGDGSGAFMASYDLTFSFACEDASSTKKEKMQITFRIDADRKNLILQGELEPERSDEF